MSKVKHISVEELAGNLADILDNVRAEHTSVVVEYANGEKVLIKPFSPPNQELRKEAVEDAGTLPNTPNHKPDSEDKSSNMGSMEAVFEIDPDSITPG
jgi:hypothetical protein